MSSVPPPPPPTPPPSGGLRRVQVGGRPTSVPRSYGWKKFQRERRAVLILIILIIVAVQIVLGGDRPLHGRQRRSSGCILVGRQLRHRPDRSTIGIINASLMITAGRDARGRQGVLHRPLGQWILFRSSTASCVGDRLRSCASSRGDHRRDLWASRRSTSSISA